MAHRWSTAPVAILLLSLATRVSAQQPGSSTPSGTAASAEREDTRTQYPAWLANSYFSVDLGYLGYGFSNRQLEPGFTAERIDVPHVAARVVPFGHEFNRFLSAQVSYMRAVRYVSYTNVNGDEAGHHLFVHFGALTLKPQLPVGRRWSIYGEAGLGITSRRALVIDEVPVVREAHYASVLLGGGLDGRVTGTLDVTAGWIYSPGKARSSEPHTMFWSGGFRYTMRPLPPERVESNRASGFIFPAQLIQVEYSTGYGYGVNDFVSKTVPIFWGGNVKVARGVAVHYTRNVFHTRKLFALDVGTSASSWRSRDNGDRFATLSVYPLLRFTLRRARAADFYVSYSLAGPTYISRTALDSRDTGNHFTFQDFMGAGVFVGSQRRVSIGLKINHYSNGNLFTKNAGVKVPLTVFAGYAF